jgi:hypothetical protein
MPQELFKKTVGPLREAFMVYNSQGRSKGMAIVMFQRAEDAAVAQKKYHGKIVDARTSHLDQCLCPANAISRPTYQDRDYA